MFYRFIFPALLLTFLCKAAYAFQMGPLTQFLQPGIAGAWSLSNQNGAAVFENRTAEGDLTYYYVGPQPGEAGNRKISVDIGILQKSGFSKAGLLYGFENDPRSYFMFTIDGQSTLRLEYRSPTGWEERISTSLEGLSTDKATLAIHENGNQISLLVNDREYSTIGNNRIGRGAVGIVAAGIGTYSFQDFSINMGGSSGNDQQPVDTAPQALNAITSTPHFEGTHSSLSGDNSLPEGVLHVKPVEIMDKHGFEKPVRAASMLIPADWKFEGTVHWVLDGCFKGTHVVYDAISPDDRSNLSLLPSVNAHWSQLGPMNNCLFQRAQRAEDMLEPVIDQVMKNTKIIKMERNPELAALNQQSLYQDTGFRSWTDHIVATVDHERNGEQHRAAVLLYTNHTQMIAPMIDGPMESMLANALPVIFSAPVDQFEQYNLAQNLIMATYRVDPNWQARMNKHRQVIADDNRRTSENIAQINRTTNAEIAAMRAGMQDNTSASNDRSHRRIHEMLTETQTVDGGNGPVRVPAGTVWQTSNGSMFVSQNSAFNPNNFGFSAKKLTPIR